MDLELNGQVAIVTGAGSGIGAACAQAFAAEGCRVVVADIDPEGADSVAESIRAAWGCVDILLNNAGFSRDGAVGLMSDSHWHDMLDVNLTGHFKCIREVSPQMCARGYGRIINMCSRAHFGDVNKSNYAAAKAGVIGLSKALSLVLALTGVTVNVIAPGLVEMARLSGLAQFPEIHSRAMGTMPIKRMERPQEVAAAAMFLASVHAGFITGEVLHISGGRFGQPAWKNQKLKIKRGQT